MINQRIEAGLAATTSVDGALLAVSAASGPARLTLFAGQPLPHPRVQRGPFVASNAEQVQRFIARFQSGGFGTLIPFAAQPDWKPNDGQERAE